MKPFDWSTVCTNSAAASTVTSASITEAMAAMQAVLDAAPKDFPQAFLFLQTEWAYLRKHLPILDAPSPALMPPVQTFAPYPSLEGTPVHLAANAREHRELLFELLVQKRVRVGAIKDTVLVVHFPPPVSDTEKARPCQPL